MGGIKNFERYTRVQRFGNGFSQWRKDYDDGGHALVAIDDSRTTRALVRSAFQAYEEGLAVDEVFTKECARFHDLEY